MASIIFNEELRQFSVIDDQRNFAYDPKAEWNKFHPAKPVKAKPGQSLYNFGKNTKRNAIIGGVATSVVGGVAGRAIARKKARAAGASEEEIKAAGRKGALAGAGVGALAGAGAGYGISKYAKSKGSFKLNELNQKGEAGKLARDKHKQRQELKKEMSKGWNTLGNGVSDRESAAKYMESLKDPKEKMKFRMAMKKKNLHFSDEYGY